MIDELDTTESDTIWCIPIKLFYEESIRNETMLKRKEVQNDNLLIMIVTLFVFGYLFIYPSMLYFIWDRNDKSGCINNVLLSPIFMSLSILSTIIFIITKLQFMVVRFCVLKKPKNRIIYINLFGSLLYLISWFLYYSREYLQSCYQWNFQPVHILFVTLFSAGITILLYTNLLFLIILQRQFRIKKYFFFVINKNGKRYFVLESRNEP
jgi:hypothetical protein